MQGGVVATMLGATISKVVTALLRWLCLALGLGWQSREAAAAPAFIRLWRLLRRPTSPPWSELQPELLGLVLSRVPSHGDRIRLRAVCRPWRSAPLPPPFPWIVLRDDTFLTLPDRALHRLPRHPCGDVIVIRVSTGSMLFLGHSDGRCCLVNPSSGETTPLNISLAGYNSSRIRKVLLSDHIVAFLIKGKLIVIPRGYEPQRGARHMTWPPPAVNSLDATVVDIAVFQGKLYALTQKYNDHGRQQPELHLLDINDEQNCVRSVQCISTTPRNVAAPWLSAIRAWRFFFFYLVASVDRLLLVERHIAVAGRSFPIGRLRPIHTRFEVSEAVDLVGGHGRWSKVDTLMGRALFVGRQCSESLPAECGAREDCIYFMTDHPNSIPGLGGKPEDDLPDCVVYNVRQRTMEPLTSETGAARDGLWQPTWLFPADG